MKKYAVAIALLISAARLFAQDAVPTGTILPVQLNHFVRTDNAKPGQEISARVMQDIPLPAGGKIRAGAKVLGEVVAVKPATKGNRRGNFVTIRHPKIGRSAHSYRHKSEGAGWHDGRS